MATVAVQEVCKVIQDVLANCFILCINQQEVITTFCWMNYPNWMGVINSTHIPLLFSPQGAIQFINYKGFSSIMLQGIVNHCGQFTHIFSSWVGNAHDFRAFYRYWRTVIMPGPINTEVS